jgi:hypothetical protein
MTTTRTPRKQAKRWNFLALDHDDRPLSVEDWYKHRSEIMEYDAVSGKRPIEWWLYEHGMERPDNEGAALYEMGNELRPEELDYVVGFWREHFDKAMSSCCPSSWGPDGQILKGLEAQRAWIKWAGIPDSLLTRWYEERTP